MTMRSLLSDDPATITINANTASVAAQSFIDTVKSWCRHPGASMTDEQSMGVTLTGLTPTSIVTGEFDVSMYVGPADHLMMSLTYSCTVVMALDMVYFALSGARSSELLRKTLGIGKVPATGIGYQS
jgi:hypothetical protein